MTASSVRYRFSDSASVGVLLGMSLRQAVPLVAGVLWLTLCLMLQVPLLGIAGPVVGAVVSFGRWRRAPLYEVAAPGARLLWRRWRNQDRWTRTSLLAAGPGLDDDLPDALVGLELMDISILWPPGEREVAVVSDHRSGCLSMVVEVEGAGFPVASLSEQDSMVASWGAAIAPLARAHCPVSRITWQEWSHPAGVAGHREFLAGVTASSPHQAARNDYELLLIDQAPITVAHEVLVTLTVDLRRVRRRRGVDHRQVAIDVLTDEVRQFCSRLSASGFAADAPMSAAALSTAVRLRSDPLHSAHVQTFGRSLAAATGRGCVEWGPMAVQPDWFGVRVDGSFHRSFRVATWPMLPVAADWLGPLLTVDGVTRTVSVVLEPVPLSQASSDANRQLTSIEADQMQKERHGFRLTARERRRHDDVETRERELAEGHPVFRHVGLVTVTAESEDTLEEASSRMEQAAAQSLLDLRPLGARQEEGWVASLPFGRSVRQGGWR